ncbi:MAG: AAA family ATPase [Mycolicibacterium sp.]|nr:AAA family ATPase [Mycolicibacterium sp.]MBJ7336053.1 AAA family ATPase [Mycolicibacterium sp.]
MVELLGALLPVDAPGDPREVIEALTDRVGIRISAPRESHHREGYVKFTLEAILIEEDHILDLVDERDNRARLDVRREDVDGLSVDQARAVAAISSSSWLVQPLSAPAGAGKTHSLRALRAAAARGGKEVMVVAPTGKAVDQALNDGAGDRGFTLARALQYIERAELEPNQRTVVIVDEASMVGTPDLRKLLTATTDARAKVVLVGDPHQLAPVKARGGMFEQLAEELPWAQRLSEVWRMRDPEERQASLALRSGHGNPLRTAIGWYRTHDRLHTGDPVAMASVALDGYLTDQKAGKDSLLICDTWEMADALNQRLHDTLTTPGPTVRAARDQQLRVGDVIVSRRNDATITVRPGAGHTRGDGMDQVRNGNRWRVIAVDPEKNRVAAERLTDHVRTTFEHGYLTEHVTLGYAVTVHSAQGVTTDTAHALIADTSTRSMVYVAMTRGRDTNHAYLYTRNDTEADHDHRGPVTDGEIHRLRRGTKHESARHLRSISANDDRPRTLHAEAQQTDRVLLPDLIGRALDRHDERQASRSDAWHRHVEQAKSYRAAYERMTSAVDRSRTVGIDGFEL